VAATIPVGVMPAGIAVAGNTAVVANTQSGTLSLIDLAARKEVSTIDLGPGVRPREIALTADGKKAVLDSPTLIGFLIVDLTSKQVTKIETSIWDAMGVGRIAVSGNTAYLTNQLSASVTVVDVAAGKVLRVIPVDPGPRARALNLPKNQLIVLCQGAAMLNVVDLNSSAVVARVATGETVEAPILPPGNWGALPVIDSITPKTAAIGSTFTLTINGRNLAAVKKVVFDQPSRSFRQPQKEDPNIKVTNLQVKPDGTQLTASVQILNQAEEGTRLIRFVMDRGDYYGRPELTLFMVTK
jgi:YVTN family beta-propeller protein